METSATIKSKADFDQTPASQQRRWGLEIQAAKQNQKKWWGEADGADRRYRGEAEPVLGYPRAKLNLFHGNIRVLLSILYGQVPRVDVSRRWADPSDDVARCSAEALQRLLQVDVEDDEDDFATEIRDAIQDWQICGLGLMRLRYEVEMARVPGEPAIMATRIGPTGEPEQYEAAPAIEEREEKEWEDIETEYVHWRDFVWSPARRWRDVRWVAFRAEMTRDEARARFGAEVADTLPMQQRSYREQESGREEGKEVWSRIQVWEIWSKTDKKVYWFCEGHDAILDVKDDPLGLKGFFPCPKPLVSNVTTTKLLPRPNFEIDKDLYQEIDDIAARLRDLVRRARVSGAYNKAFPELARILENATEGQLVPVDGWAGFAESGGIAGAMQFVPLEGIVAAVNVLSVKLQEKIQLLYQATGLSDVIRGQASTQATATERRIQAGFASTRLQADQDEVARFASDLQRMRAEMVAKLFDPKTIVERSNIALVEVDPATKQPNMELIQRAVSMIKDSPWQYRIEIKSDSIALRDYAALKAERSESIQTLTGLLQAGLPLAQAMPQAGPFVLELARWLIAATKGAQQLEGVFDRFVDQVEQAAAAPKPPPPPDPKAEALKAKSQADIMQAKAKAQQTMLDGQVHVAKAKMDMQRSMLDHQIKTTEARQRLDSMSEIAAVLPPGRLPQ